MPGDRTMSAASGSIPEATTVAPCTAPRHSRRTFMRCKASVFGSSGSGRAAQAANSVAPAGEAASMTFCSSWARRP
jgi:hypothetical protein